MPRQRKLPPRGRQQRKRSVAGVWTVVGGGGRGVWVGLGLGSGLGLGLGCVCSGEGRETSHRCVRTLREVQMSDAAKLRSRHERLMREEAAARASEAIAAKQTLLALEQDLLATEA